MYKHHLLEKLEEYHEEVAMELSRAIDEDDEEEADECLERLYYICKGMKYTQMMVDGTLGKMPLTHTPHHAEATPMYGR